MSNLENQIKQLIIDSLGLEDITVADIGSEDPLFGDDGLGLDSVDALELGLAVQKTFGFQLDGENDNLRENFANVKTLAEFVKSRQANRNASNPKPTSTKIWKSTASTLSTLSTTSNAKPAANCKPKTSATCVP